MEKSTVFPLERKNNKFPYNPANHAGSIPREAVSKP